MSRLAAWLAIVVAGPLFVAQLVRNWGNWEYWQTWGVDLLVAVLLASAGLAALRGAAPKYLAAAWAFATAMYLSSFVSHQYHASHTEGAMHDAETRLTMIIGALLVACLAGAALSLFGRRSGGRSA